MEAIVHLIADPHAKVRDYGPSSRTGLRLVEALERGHQGNLINTRRPSLHQFATNAQVSHQHFIIELEGEAPRFLFIQNGSDVENLTEVEIIALRDIAAGRCGDLVSWDELPVQAERVRWRRRERQTDPDLEARADTLRAEITKLQDELAATEQLLTDQVSGEYDRRLAAEAEQRARDVAAIAEHAEQAERRRWQRQRARQAGKLALERLGAAELGLDPADLGIPAAAGGVDWGAVEKRKKALLAQKPAA
jgi:hypothetical protein